MIPSGITSLRGSPGYKMREVYSPRQMDMETGEIY